jgi:hypothetical protein
MFRLTDSLTGGNVILNYKHDNRYINIFIKKDIHFRSTTPYFNQWHGPHSLPVCFLQKKWKKLIERLVGAVLDVINNPGKNQ